MHLLVRFPCAVAALVVLSACASAGEGVVVDDALVEGAHWSGTLLPRGMPPLGGTAVMSPVTGSDAETIAIISIRGAPPSSSAALAWRIHRGVCDGPGQVFGAPASYPVFTLQPDGTGQATAVIREPIPTTGVFSVRLHPSPTRLGEVIACGTLRHAEP